MRVSFIFCFLLLIGCSSRRGHNEVKRLDSISVDYGRKEKDSLSFVFSTFDVVPNSTSIDLCIKSFNLDVGVIGVEVENLQSDTLICGNVVYQTWKCNSWVTIPSAFEDVGWIILPGEESYSTYGLPHEYNFVAGKYKVVFSFTNSRDKRYNVNAYFELSR